MDATHNTVYIETSIPSFYHTLRTDPESVARMHWTRQWWQEYAAESALVTSAAVIDEQPKRAEVQGLRLPLCERLDLFQHSAADLLEP